METLKTRGYVPTRAGIQQEILRLMDEFARLPSPAQKRRRKLKVQNYEAQGLPTDEKCKPGEFSFADLHIFTCRDMPNEMQVRRLWSQLCLKLDAMETPSTVLPVRQVVELVSSAQGQRWLLKDQDTVRRANHLAPAEAVDPLELIDRKTLRFLIGYLRESWGVTMVPVGKPTQA